MNDFFKSNEELTISEKVLIDFIESHVSELPEMTIGELSKVTYTSNATIVRLCRKLGYNGFRELKTELIRYNEAGKYIDKEVDFNRPIDRDQTAEDVISSMTSLYREGINLLSHSIRPADIQLFGEILHHAEKIYIYSIGDAQATTDAFLNKLIKLNCHPVSAMERYEHVRVSSNVTHKDCALFVSYSGTQEGYKECIPILKEKKCPILSIVADENSYLARMSDHVIIIPNEETSDRIATFYSQMAFSYILNILYGMVYLKRNTR